MTTSLTETHAPLIHSARQLAPTDRALQVHGGHGYTRELPIERYYRDARGLKLMEGQPRPFRYPISDV
jgi:alkylation response protein AidB-like acyl-CoA dehydrogenase